MRNDTIAAIATPLGEGGIGIVRMSGPQAQEIGAQIFTGRLRDRYLAHGYVIDPVTGERVDEVLAVLMRAPRTYTREDVVEFHGHGGPVPLQRILSLCLRSGARQAEPGEFTLRAFLNGRLDLCQAEAVLDVIQAKTDASLRLALQGLSGRLSARIAAVRQELLSVLAYLTARIDFPDDDVPAADVTPQLHNAAASLRRLCKTADTGMIYRTGLRTAIIGRPNVGKSSLLNRLLRENRAIVTDIPGTTRDTLEEMMNLRGLPLVLTDTAGINEATADVVERLGIERSRQALARSDFVLLVLDSSEPLTDRDRELITAVTGRPALAVLNKRDLPARIQADEVPLPSVRVSALTGEGIEELEEAILRAVTGCGVTSSDDAIITNVRHKEALERALRHVESAIAGFGGGATEDLIAVDLTSALTALGEITGEAVTEDLLDTIFSRFCIGK